MAAATPIPFEIENTEPLQLTLLELVGVVSEVAADDREVVATVVHMLRSGRVRLCGNFRGTPPEELC